MRKRRFTIAALLIAVAVPAAAADAKKRKFRGIAITSVSKRGGSSVRPPTTFTARVGLSNPNRRRARPQPISITLGSFATTNGITPFMRRRSRTTVSYAVNLPTGIPSGNYTLQACNEGRVFPGASPCGQRSRFVNVLAPRVTLSISPTSHAFGNVTVGTASPQQTFTVTNTSLTQSGVPTVSLTGVGYQLGSNGCTVAISPGNTCALTAFFNPTTTGNSSGSVRVTASGDTATATLTGNGV